MTRFTLNHAHRVTGAALILVGVTLMLLDAIGH